MKAFTMFSLVFVVVAIAMIPKATGKYILVFLSKFLLILQKNLESTINDQLRTNHCFSGCGQWFEKIGKCKQATDVADLLLCCKLIGVPYECSGYCLPEELGCRKWFQQVDRCVEDNDGISCCEE